MAKTRVLFLYTQIEAKIKDWLEHPEEEIAKLKAERERERRERLEAAGYGSLEMNDQVVARCQEMGLDELASFIGDSLEKMHDPDPGRVRPHTYEEFLIVWRQLRKKSDAMPHNPSAPRNPLEKAYAKRIRTENLLYGESPDRPKLTKKDKHHIKLRLDSLNLHIEKMEESGEYDHSPVPDPKTTKQAAAQTATKVFEDIERSFKHLPKGRRRSGYLASDNRATRHPGE